MDRCGCLKTLSLIRIRRPWCTAKRAAKAGGEKAIPAASFTDQIRAAKTARDPLLDKLVPNQTDRPIPPKR